MTDEAKTLDEHAKPWWQSKGVVGGIVTFAVGVAAGFGWVDLDPAHTESITDNVLGIIMAAAGLWNTFSRVVAKGSVTS